MGSIISLRLTGQRDYEPYSINNLAGILSERVKDGRVSGNS